MTLVHAIIIAILQGISELFPVSSLGHAVLLPKLLHWGIDQKAESWLAFLVALHLGTAAALLIYFRDDWVSVVRALVRSVQRGQMSGDHDERLAWMVILGTLPAGLVGFVLEHPLRNLFGSPYAAAGFLIVNGLIMLGGERLLQRQLASREEMAVLPTVSPAVQVALVVPSLIPSTETSSWRRMYRRSCDQSGRAMVHIRTPLGHVRRSLDRPYFSARH